MFSCYNFGLDLLHSNNFNQLIEISNVLNVSLKFFLFKILLHLHNCIWYNYVKFWINIGIS